LIPYWEQLENKNVNLNIQLKKEIKNIDFGINNMMILENKSEIFKKKMKNQMINFLENILIHPINLNLTKIRTQNNV